MGNFLTKNLIFLLFTWLLFVFSFVISLQHDSFKEEWSRIISFLQLAADVYIGVFGYLFYKNREEKIIRKFSFLIFTSLIPGLFANEAYNIIINVIHIGRSESNGLYWEITYSFFLLIQIYAWFYLFFIRAGGRKNYKWLTIYPYLISALIIFSTLIFILFIKNDGVYFSGILNSALEVILFTLISINLSRTKNKSLIFLEIGFLLLIGFNIAHRFSDILSIYYKVFDIAWILCLIVIIHGLYFLLKNPQEDIYFFEENSIHVLMSGTFILFADLVLIIFVIGAFGLAAFQIDKAPNLKIIMIDIPSAFIFSYSCTLLLSKFFTWRLSFPLEQIVYKITKIAEGKKNINTSYDKQLKICEVEILEKFIIKTISDLYRANSVKSKFLMNMSHDFRTPASGILYMSRLVHDRLSDKETKKLQKMIVDSSEQLMTFLDDILDYSRLEHDQISLKNKSFDIVYLVNEVIDFMSAKAHEHSLVINVICAEDKMICYFDRDIIRRIILNLLSNAIKFTHVGEINISASFSIMNDRKHLLISIKDTGIGIDKVNHIKIFEPFYTVENAGSSSHRGIGLGLSNVNLMVKKLNGQIFLKSELGLGAEFSICLPLV